MYNEQKFHVCINICLRLVDNHAKYFENNAPKLFSKNQTSEEIWKESWKENDHFQGWESSLHTVSSTRVYCD